MVRLFFRSDVLRLMRLAMLSGLMATSGACFAQVAATVVFSSGAVQIVARDGQARAAACGAELNAGETIETDDGRAQLRFVDGAMMSLQPSTRFRIDEFRFTERAGQASPEDRGIFSLIKGGFRTLTGLIGKARREQYKVDAVVATIGIRGTDYAAKLGESGLAVTTHGGSVEVCNDGGCAVAEAGQTVNVVDKVTAPRLEGGDPGTLSGELKPPLNVQPPVTTPTPGQGQMAPVSAPATGTGPTGGSNFPSVAGPNLR